MLTGTTNPTGATGNNGDSYINTATSTLFGPKASGAWPAGVSLIGAALPLSGGTLTGSLILNANPTVALGATPKQYVDALTQKLSARTATSSNITATYANGTLGVGATLTGTGALGAINGVTLALRDRILVKNQTTASQNGIYELTTVNPFVLTRTIDFNTTDNIQAGDAFFIGEGTLASTQWVMNAAGAITVGTTSITFIQPTVGTAQGGTGLTTIGAGGQVLRVKQDLTGLEWGTIASGGGDNTEMIVLRYGTDNTFQSSAGGGLITKTNNVSVTITNALANQISLTFANRTTPPKSFTYYGQNSTTNVWRITPAASASSFTMTGTVGGAVATSGTPDLANMLFNSLNAIAMTLSTGSTNVSGTSPYVVIVIGF